MACLDHIVLADDQPLLGDRFPQFLEKGLGAADDLGVLLLRRLQQRG